MSSKAYLIVLIRQGHMDLIHVVSSWPVAQLRGDRNFLIAWTKGRDFEAAMNKLNKWWRGRTSWQKRALLNNATVESWQPLEVR